MAPGSSSTAWIAALRSSSCPGMPWSSCCQHVPQSPSHPHPAPLTGFGTSALSLCCAFLWYPHSTPQYQWQHPSVPAQHPSVAAPLSTRAAPLSRSPPQAPDIQLGPLNGQRSAAGSSLCSNTTRFGRHAAAAAVTHNASHTDPSRCSPLGTWMHSACRSSSPLGRPSTA